MNIGQFEWLCARLDALIAEQKRTNEILSQLVKPVEAEYLMTMLDEATPMMDASNTTQRILPRTAKRRK